MTALAHIADDIGRHLVPLKGARQSGERMNGGQADARQVGRGSDAYARVSGAEDEIEVLGLGRRGRPVVSMPSSAFFAQHIGQHPERRNREMEQTSADAAYRDALDLGVLLERPAPVSLAV